MNLSKMMKKTDISKTAREVIHNKYVLYAVFFAALIDLLYSVVKEDYLYCVLFILVGFLTAFFNKNMTVILTLTMAMSTILRNIIRGGGMKLEGMEANSDSKSKSNENEETKTSLEETSDPGSSASGKTLVVDSEKKSPDTPAKTPAKLMNELKEKALDLQEAQQNIIQGFQKIEPYMDKAENLIGSIQETAQTIQDMRNKNPQ